MCIWFWVHCYIAKTFFIARGLLKLFCAVLPIFNLSLPTTTESTTVYPYARWLTHIALALSAFRYCCIAVRVELIYVSIYKKIYHFFQKKKLLYVSIFLKKL